MTLALLVRLALAPCLVAVATVAARRWGASAGGWAAATPVVAGPVLLVFTVDHGAAFGSQAASSATLGLISLAVFTVTYARLAMAGVPWALCLVLGWASFVAGTAVLSVVAVPTLVALGVALLSFALLRSATGSKRVAVGTERRLPADIPLRMIAALVMVLVLGFVAAVLGPRVSGLLAPFPIIGSVMAAFTHISRGRDALQGYSLALLKGMPSFALFTATVAVLLQPLGTMGAFVLASLVAVASHTVLIYLDNRVAAPGRRPALKEV
ncbi:MAG: hypothetical protein NVSMB17_01020 [Candidatus Dormibacteria bacterium]